MKTVIIIGAGPAGLACGGALKMRGIEPRILERDAVASAWRNHYDGLRLHTHRSHSGLPGFPMPRTMPGFPGRGEVIAYLESYARHHGLKPETGVTVNRVVPGKNARWKVESGSGTHEADDVIVAMGIAGAPLRPDWPGLDSFPGPVIHSNGYHDPAPFVGQRVLVVGFGNSAGEIAAQLAEAGIAVEMSVRSPVNVIPKMVLGQPSQRVGIWISVFPPHVADMLNAPILKLRYGDLARLGLRKSGKGPVRSIIEDGRVPMIDTGMIAHMREGRIGIRQGIERIDGATVHFTDQTSGSYDAIIAAIGFAPDLRRLLPETPAVLSDAGAPQITGRPSGAPGLWFCGYRQSPTGQLREVGIEAVRIAGLIAP